ncbi:ATP-dependent RNA helicase DHX36 [Porphyridium purpureum]|uniref:ATP-dependent RNA helicase DHX36 n=1 Tax=Porphyridium purpureum TaxID=35688 RepID=A0A5J4Z767_PORPP|nr:ATP-dependent RNA helicase DHX36 [Porphyridium purpureum]|eukprot:POR8090..scf295_1
MGSASCWMWRGLAWAASNQVLGWSSVRRSGLLPRSRRDLSSLCATSRQRLSAPAASWSMRRSAYAKSISNKPLKDPQAKLKITEFLRAMSLPPPTYEALVAGNKKHPWHTVYLYVALPQKFQRVVGHRQLRTMGRSRSKKEATQMANMEAVTTLEEYVGEDLLEFSKKAMEKLKEENKTHKMDVVLGGPREYGQVLAVDIPRLIAATSEPVVEFAVRVSHLLSVDPPVEKFHENMRKDGAQPACTVMYKVFSGKGGEVEKVSGAAYGIPNEHDKDYVQGHAYIKATKVLKTKIGQARFIQLSRLLKKYSNLGRATLYPRLTGDQEKQLSAVLEKLDSDPDYVGLLKQNKIVGRLSGARGNKNSARNFPNKPNLIAENSNAEKSDVGEKGDERVWGADPSAEEMMDHGEAHTASSNVGSVENEPEDTSNGRLAGAELERAMQVSARLQQELLNMRSPGARTIRRMEPLPVDTMRTDILQALQIAPRLDPDSATDISPSEGHNLDGEKAVNSGIAASSMEKGEGFLGQGESVATAEVGQVTESASSSALLPGRENMQAVGPANANGTALSTSASLASSPAEAYVARTRRAARVLVFQGGTGSGKTTRIPQFILDDYIEKGIGHECKIIISEPRRIAAVSAANRVASERGEQVGESVGYHIRLERKKPRHFASMEFVTTGVLLRRLQANPNCHGISHIIVDEVHERDANSDMLLIALREALKTNPYLSIVLMSATLEAAKFVEYFRDFDSLSIEVPSATRFQIKNVYLEDLEGLLPEQRSPLIRRLLNMERDMRISTEERDLEVNNKSWKVDEKNFERRQDATYDELMCSLCANLVQTLIAKQSVPTAGPARGGTMLCFLPGWDEIQHVRRLLSGMTFDANVKVLMMHSSLPAARQREVFIPVPANTVKVVLSTNIAETSITIEDVTVVIDTARAREMTYHPSARLSSLDCVHVSKESLTQRRGRAGRVRPGTCYRLISRDFYMQLDNSSVPEIQRCSLETLGLLAKGIFENQNLRTVLASALDPPSRPRVDDAINELVSMGAMRIVADPNWRRPGVPGDPSAEDLEGESQVLTPLGKVLAQLPLDPLLGRMVLLSVLMKGVEIGMSIAAVLSVPSIFLSSNVRDDGDGKQADRRGPSDNNFSKTSDILAAVRAFLEWEKTVRQRNFELSRSYALQRGLSISSLQVALGVKDQIRSSLVSNRFLPRDYRPDAHEFNVNCERLGLHVALVCSAVPSLAHRINNRVLLTRTAQNAVIHPGSVNASGEGAQAAWYSYVQLMQTTNVFVRDSTAVSPIDIMLFGGSGVSDQWTGAMVLDHWIVAKGNIRDMEVFKKARSHLSHFLQLQSVLPDHQLLEAQSELLSQVISLIEEVRAPTEIV